MRNIKLTIEYDGTDYKGWQIQKSTSKTIQGQITDAIHELTKEKVSLIGSGRTDSGVHAIAQTANFKTKSKLTASEFKKALNAKTPEDIVITDAQEVPDKFHAQYSVKSKIYRYTILNRSHKSPIHARYSLFVYQKLNLNQMRKEAKSLLGKHDFKSFQVSDPAKRHLEDKGNTVRKIKRLDIKKKGDFIFIEIEANGFLYKMVRSIVGTLLDVGYGKLQKGSIKAILTKKNRCSASACVKPHGLCLVEVRY